MKCKKKTRFILQAARTTVDVIERNGFKCILVGPIAGYLHGCRTVPQDVSLVVFPNSDGYPNPEHISEILRHNHPFHFRIILHQALNAPDLRYYDSLSEREHFCMIHLLRVDNVCPINIGDIVRLKNLPAAPLIHVLIDHLRAMVTFLETPGNHLERPSSQMANLNNLLLAAKGRPLSASSNALFNQDASSVLGRALDLLPQFSRVLLTATQFPPTIHPSAGYFGSTSLPTATNMLDDEISNVAFVDSLGEIDSDEEGIQLHSSGRHIDSRVSTICRIAKKVVRLLDDLKIECALFGSAACWLYGNTRVPDDLDFVAFPPPELSREQLKYVIQEAHPRLHLERSANPNADFKILYFHLDGINGPRGFFPGNKCKIDILLPGILHLPYLSGSKIPKIGGLPVVPFSVLLLQKLQAWDDHRKLRWTDPKKYAKASIDARDLQQLLTLEQHVAPLRASQPWNDSSLFSEEFQVLSRQRVRDFCGSFPACTQDFELLGFFVDLDILTKE